MPSRTVAYPPSAIRAAVATAERIITRFCPSAIASHGGTPPLTMDVQNQSEWMQTRVPRPSCDDATHGRLPGARWPGQDQQERFVHGETLPRRSIRQLALTGDPLTGRERSGRRRFGVVRSPADGPWRSVR